MNHYIIFTHFVQNYKQSIFHKYNTKKIKYYKFIIYEMLTQVKNNESLLTTKVAEYKNKSFKLYIQNIK